jgi:hypothetical protein
VKALPYHAVRASAARPGQSDVLSGTLRAHTGVLKGRGDGNCSKEYSQGYSQGTQNVLTGVLTGYSECTHRGTPGVLTGVSPSTGLSAYAPGPGVADGAADESPCDADCAVGDAVGDADGPAPAARECGDFAAVRSRRCLRVKRCHVMFWA